MQRVVLVPQLCAQLAHVASCGWWRGGGGSPLHQPKLATWASCAQSCAQRLCHQNFPNGTLCLTSQVIDLTFNLVSDSK